MKAYFATVGAAALVAAVMLLVRRLRVLWWGEKTDGQVVGHQARTLEDAVFHMPIVSFVDRDGRTQRFTSVAGAAFPHPRVGDAVTVRYDANDPACAYIGTFLHMWAAPLACVILAAAALVVCVKL